MAIRFIVILMVIALIQSCKNPVALDSDYLVRIKIKSDSAISFNDSSRIKILLFAYDNGVVDAPGTNIKTIDTLITSLNGEYIFEFNRNDFETVRPSSGRGEYMYYFSFTINLNNDGQICIGDFVEDYDRSPFVSYSQEDSGDRRIELYAKKVISGNCYEF